MKASFAVLITLVAVLDAYFGHAISIKFEIKESNRKQNQHSAYFYHVDQTERKKEIKMCFL